MQISPQFEQIQQRSPLETSIPSFKSIGLVVLEKMIFDQKWEKLPQKYNYANFTTI